MTEALSRGRSADAFALAEALYVQAQLAIRQGRWEEAMHALEEGLTIRRALPQPYEEARLLHAYGLLYVRNSAPVLARERLEEALAIFRRLGARKDSEQTERLLATLG